MTFQFRLPHETEGSNPHEAAHEFDVLRASRGEPEMGYGAW
jgi:hypothetical protein